jgi:hypothetical protein
MHRLQGGILEQVDVSRRLGAEGDLRLVENELLSPQRACRHLQPTVLEGTLPQAHGGPGGGAEYAIAN